MSTLKKIGALIMALAMCLALAMPAFAADKGSITIENAKSPVQVEGKEGDQKNIYTAYKIFDATPYGGSNDKTKPSATTAGNVVYTATSEQKDYWEKVTPKLFDFTTDSEGNIVVSLHKGVGSKQIAEYFNENHKALIGKTGLLGAAVQMPIVNGKAVATGLDYGYYFISSNNGSVVTIDTTNPDVVIEDKNTYKGTGFNPGDGENPDGQLKDVYSVTHGGKTTTMQLVNKDDGTKEMEKADVYIGDTVTYHVSTGTSNYVVKNDSGALDPNGKVSEKVTYVYVTDTMGAGLKVNEDSFVVKVGGTEIDSSRYKTDVSEDGKTFTLVTSWTGVDGNHLYTDGAKLTVEYSATVTADIGVVDGLAPDKSGDNKAQVTVDSTKDNNEKPEDPEDPIPDPTAGEKGEGQVTEEDTVSLYTYALAINKVKAEDGAPLPGAQFKVQNKESGETLKFVKDNNDDVYVYSTDAAALETVESNASGVILMKGVGDGTYVVTETKAPDTYNLLVSPVEYRSIANGTTSTTKKATTITYYEEAKDGEYVKEGDNQFVAKTGNEAEGTKFYAIADTKTTEFTTTETTEDKFSLPAVSQTIENGKGTELPSTGGIGTTIFYVVGGAMVIGAGVLLITKKRMAE